MIGVVCDWYGGSGGVIYKQLVCVCCAQVLGTYLKELDDLEGRYQLAMEVRLYVAALDCLVALKDKDRVNSFIGSVPPQKHYEIRAKVNQILANTVSLSIRECGSKPLYQGVWQ